MIKNAPVFESIVSNILLLAGLMLIVLLISFVVTKKFGSQTTTKKKVIFTLTCGFGLLLAALYIVNKISGA